LEFQLHAVYLLYRLYRLYLLYRLYRRCSSSGRPADGGALGGGALGGGAEEEVLSLPLHCGDTL
jgi:hypothetical protein